MIYAVLLLALALHTMPPREPDPLDGRYISARYASGVMKRVARNRGMEWSGCGLAFDGPGIGATVRVRGVRTGEERNCTVYDISAPRDLKRHLNARQIEMDHAAARAICGEAAYLLRPRECPVDVVVLMRGTR